MGRTLEVRTLDVDPYAPEYLVREKNHTIQRKERDDGLDPGATEHHISAMNESPSPTRSTGSPTILLSLIAIIILLVVVGLLWKMHVDSKSLMEKLSAQNLRLEQDLKNAQAEINDLNSGDSSPATRERLSSMRESRPSQPVVDEVETLVLQAPTVRQSPAGLVVHFEFKPADGIELPEDIILAVRLPMSSSSKLLELAPVAGTENANIRTVINPAGYIGFIQGSPDDMGALAFEFTVSAPVKAVVSGSEGIVDFEFDITPDGCTVRKL